MALKVITIPRDRPLPRAKRGVEYRYADLVGHAITVRAPKNASGNCPIRELVIDEQRIPCLVMPKRGTRIVLPSFLTRSKRLRKRLKRWSIR